MNMLPVTRLLYLSLILLTFIYTTDAQSAGGLEVHNTGVNTSDVLVNSGQPAAFWILSAKPAAASQTLGSSPFRYRNGAYFADTATAAWVSPGSNGNAVAAGTYVYALEVDLNGFYPDSVSIAGVFGTDNDGAIWLNDESPVATTTFGGFGSQTAFTIDNGWVPGVNTIYVSVNNGGDPTALFVQFNTVTAVPIPTTPIPALGPTGLMLLLATLAGIGLLRVRRQRII